MVTEICDDWQMNSYRERTDSRLGKSRSQNPRTAENVFGGRAAGALVWGDSWLDAALREGDWKALKEWVVCQEPA